MNTQEILNERATTHGDFNDNAHVSQELKRVLLGNCKGLTAVQAEALDMICLKLSRIASNPNVKDHWADISGYATLAANRLP